MKFAYADPPYLGCAMKHYGDHPEAGVYDTIEGHRALIDSLSEYDGWALSMTSGNLQHLLSLCPQEVRVAAWVKPFCSFKPNVNPAYAWEPVIFNGGRRRPRWDDKVRDWASINVTLKKGFPGAKPAEFVWWMLDLLNAEPSDEIVDLFPGSGSVQRAIDAWREAHGAREIQAPLFGGSDGGC